ncbi:hypothetical protein [Dyadobacter psychrotolerans]|uniref:Uncharacterized protein n=1 Tax=Dyadobacter psychrotolerans TaxID=2541721 RepID=A0A4R5DKP9_9BACT|nr:hypothetical protein [Dyadobacter psychrotolerans]TDE14629.1 hypothetical protein E0F88_15665 [Dyadobacter psychrotolerans]
MNNFTKTAHNLFIVFIIIFLIASLAAGKRELDVNLHDTYLVFPAYLLLGLVIFIFVVFYLLYHFLHQFLWSKYLTRAHILLTISILSVFAIEKTFFGFMSIDSYAPYGGFQKYHQQLMIIQAGLVLLIVAQALFIINLAVGIVVRRK